MLRKDKVVNILPGKGSWLGEFFDPAEPEDYWETPHVHHVTWWYLVLSWRLSHRLSCRSCQLTFQGKFQVQSSTGFAQFSCFTHLLRFPRGVASSDVTCSVLAFPAIGRLFLPKVSFKCIAKRCRLLTFDSRSLHKAIEEGGLAEVPWMFFFDVFLCDRKRIKNLKTES